MEPNTNINEILPKFKNLLLLLNKDLSICVVYKDKDAWSEDEDVNRYLEMYVTHVEVDIWNNDETGQDEPRMIITVDDSPMIIHIPYFDK